jgi:hypothetical protein
MVGQHIVTKTFSILFATATNIITNPDFETNAANWLYDSAFNLTRDNTYAYTGSWSLKIETAASSYVFPGQGTYSSFYVVPAGNRGKVYTGYCYVYSVAGGEDVRYAIEEFDAGTSQSVGSIYRTATLTAGWNLLTATNPILLSTGYISWSLWYIGNSNPTIWMDNVYVGLSPVQFLAGRAATNGRIFSITAASSFVANRAAINIRTWAASISNTFAAVTTKISNRTWSLNVTNTATFDQVKIAVRS